MSRPAGTGVDRRELCPVGTIHEGATMPVRFASASISGDGRDVFRDSPFFVRSVVVCGLRNVDRGGPVPPWWVP